MDKMNKCLECSSPDQKPGDVLHGQLLPWSPCPDIFPRCAGRPLLGGRGAYVMIRPFLYFSEELWICSQRERLILNISTVMIMAPLS